MSEELSKHLTLAQAARITPGEPSPQCLWRWCRRGVKSRAGQRVRLQHIRIGGMIYTTAKWLEEFGQRLAQADAIHFDLSEQELSIPRPHRSRRIQRISERQATLERVEHDLQEAGI